MTRGWVPILGGSGFILLSLVAVILDLVDERKREEVRARTTNRPPDPILIRYVSAITFVPTSRSAVCFFVGTVVFLVGASITGTWQSQLLDLHLSQLEDPDSLTTKPNILVSSIVMGASIFLLSLGAWINRVHQGLGMAVHMPLAGIFQASVIVYGFATVNLAKTLYDDDAPATIMREAVLYIAVVSMVTSFLWLMACNKKTMKLVAHMRAEEQMVQQQAAARSLEEVDELEQVIEEVQEEVDNGKDSSPIDEGEPGEKAEEDPPAVEDEQQEKTTEEDPAALSEGEGNLLSAEERLSCRRYEAALATVQYALGTCAGLLLAFGAADV